MVVALYLLLPADATNTTVITTLFYDSLTTTAVVNERLGTTLCKPHAYIYRESPRVEALGFLSTCYRALPRLMSMEEPCMTCGRCGM